MFEHVEGKGGILCSVFVFVFGFGFFLFDVEGLDGAVVVGEGEDILSEFVGEVEEAGWSFLFLAR